MRAYREIVWTSLAAYLIGSLLIIWGLYQTGGVRIIVGFIIIVLYTKNAIDHYRFIRELATWRSENNGKLIFFYPTKRELQIELEKKILPLMPKDILRVYYEGPTLAGDIKRSIVLELMKQYKELQVNLPSVFKIIDDQIYIESLKDLMDLELNTDLSSFKERLDKIVSL